MRKQTDRKFKVINESQHKYCVFNETIDIEKIGPYVCHKIYLGRNEGKVKQVQLCVYNKVEYVGLNWTYT